MRPGRDADPSPVFAEGKMRPGRDADPSPPNSDEIKNRVELFIYSS